MKLPLVRAAVFCRDAWHPAPLIQKGLASLARGEFAFDWLASPAAWDAFEPFRYDLLILAKGNTTDAGDQSPWLTSMHEEVFTQHVHSGKGILFIHGGTCYRQNPKLRALTGGAFLQHPPPCPVTLEPLAGHPMTRDVSAATLHDEHYEMILDDTHADVFLHTRSNHGVQPAGWTRQENGRICVLTPGHTDEAWANSQFQKLLDNALRWTAGIIS
jgi:hypothetical protein